MADIKSIKELALNAARHTAPTNYTVETVDEALRGELAGLCGSVNDFMRNRYDIYDIIIETAEEIVPKKVISALERFAEVKSVAQGQKAMFKRSIGKMRAKKFLTQVGLSGVYETFRLDVEEFELAAHAVGGAATIDFERMLDGSETMADVMEVLTEGLADSIFYEVEKALVAAAADHSNLFPANNYAESNVFDASEMVRVVNTVKAYGDAAIFATNEFISAMGPDVITPVYQASMGSLRALPVQEDIDSIHMTGKIHIFRGTPVVELPQSFIDENNDKTWMHPQYAYILPTGKEKVVKVALEGQTQIHDFTNRDNSLEIHTYRKMGCAILAYNNWGIYKNTGIEDTFSSPYGF